MKYIYITVLDYQQESVKTYKMTTAKFNKKDFNVENFLIENNHNVSNCQYMWIYEKAQLINIK